MRNPLKKRTGGGMPDDQQISQSVDNVIAESPSEQSGGAEPAGRSSASYSLGASPSSDNSPDDNDSATKSSLGGDGGDSPSQSSTAPPTEEDTDSGQSSNDDDLSQIKQQALTQLSPIISELDQPPEEKYRTLMMLIQASDDKKLIKNAFEAANNIEDKKAKAEALLNIVNEINYFSSAQPADKPQGELKV